MTATNYVWDFATDSYLMEKDDGGNTTAVYTNEPVQYGKLISQRRGSTTTYYHFDGQGSTRQLTDQNANVTDAYTYSAFGETVATSGTTVNQFLFLSQIGYYFDAEVEVYYVRTHEYDPALSRWTSADPLIEVDQGDLNRYVYSGYISIQSVDLIAMGSVWDWLCNWWNPPKPKPPLPPVRIRPNQPNVPQVPFREITDMQTKIWQSYLKTHGNDRRRACFALEQAQALARRNGNKALVDELAVVIDIFCQGI